MSENINKEIYTELANRIYDLDGEGYRVLGSSLGRTFTGNRDTTIRTLSMLMQLLLLISLQQRKALHNITS